MMTTGTKKTWSTQAKGKVGETRARILTMIQDNWPVSVLWIAKTYGIARTGVDRHIQLLLQEGLIRQYDTPGMKARFYVPADVDADTFSPEEIGNRLKVNAEFAASVPSPAVPSPAVPSGAAVPPTADDERRWWLEGWRQGVLETLREVRRG